MLLKEIKDLPKPYTVISFFSGYGANILGYNQAGFEAKLAVDIDKESNEVFRLNHPECPVIEADIQSLTVEEIIKASGIKKYDLDVFDISPPFRFFIKNKTFEQKTTPNELLLRITYLICELMPKTFIINVEPDIIYGKKRLFFNEALELFKELDYRVDFEILNAKSYEVPQDKEILFILGVRDDFQMNSVFPKASEKIVKTQDVIGDLLGLETDGKITATREQFMKDYIKPGATESNVKIAAIKQGVNAYGKNYKRDKWNEPFTALRGQTRPFHPMIDRVLTTKEALRLQTFPDDFILSGNSSLNWRKICNSVPPTLICQIGKMLVQNILEESL